MVEEITTSLQSLQLNTIEVVATSQSLSAPAASMKKLTIFDYNIQHYDKVLYIDSDIIVNYDLCNIFDKCVNSEKLYAYPETTNYESHKKLFFGLCTYTDADIAYFRENKIYPFNAGFFGFIPSDAMKEHFTAIRAEVAAWTGNYFYEQSFMNRYFNMKGLVDYSVITGGNYNMCISGNGGEKVLHFANAYCPPKQKYERMVNYCKEHAPHLL